MGKTLLQVMEEGFDSTLRQLGIKSVGDIRRLAAQGRKVAGNDPKRYAKVLSNIRSTSIDQNQEIAQNNIQNFLSRSSSNIQNGINTQRDRVQRAIKNIDQAHSRTLIDSVRNPEKKHIPTGVPISLNPNTNGLLIGKTSANIGGTTPNLNIYTGGNPKDIIRANRTGNVASSNNPLKIIIPNNVMTSEQRAAIESAKKNSVPYWGASKGTEGINAYEKRAEAEIKWEKENGPISFGNELEAQDLREKLQTLEEQKTMRAQIAAQQQAREDFFRAIESDPEVVGWANFGKQEVDPAALARKNGFSLDENGKIISPGSNVVNVEPREGALTFKDIEAVQQQRIEQEKLQDLNAQRVEAYNDKRRKITDDINTKALIDSPEAKEVRRRLDSAQEETKILNEGTPEQQQEYFAKKGQEQRKQQAQTRAGQRAAARAASEEAPGGISYLGAYDAQGIEGKLGYSSIAFDKDDLRSMLLDKHGEAMGAKGAIDHMVNSIEKDFNKGYKDIMSNRNIKDKKEAVDNLITSLGARIDDGLGLGDYIMGNKLHTGAAGFAAMAATMGVAFGGHKSNAELYSSPF